MGKSSKGTKGYKYFTSLVLMLGNRIECLLGVNFDKKGWQKPVVLKDDENMLAGVHQFDLPELYGDTEGGISGQLALYDGNTAQMPDSHYQQYFPLAPAYRHQSYVVLRDFYVGNSPYLKDVMFLPKRTQIRNDGSEQWYRVREDGAVVCEIYGKLLNNNIEIDYFSQVLQLNSKVESLEKKVENLEWNEQDALEKESLIIIAETVYSGESEIVRDDLGQTTKISDQIQTVKFISDKTMLNRFVLTFSIYAYDNEGNIIDKYRPSVAFDTDGSVIKSEISFALVGRRLTVSCDVEFVGNMLDATILCSKYKQQSNYIDGLPHQTIWSNIIIGLRAKVYYPAVQQHIGYDINPIHKAREIITDYTAMNKPESDINDANFRAAASRIWDEGLGISWAIQEKSCKEALQELEAHIEGGFRINRQTGLYECVLFRDDLLDLDNTLHFDESNIKTVEFDTINADDAINSYNVSYYDRENLKDSTFSIDDVGLIHTVGHVNAEKLDFPYFMNRRNSEIVANWKLKQASTAAWKGSFTTGRYEARKINKYDVVLLSWQSKQLVNVPVRVLNISLGDGVDNTVTIDFIEIVSYSENMNATINSDESMNTVLKPQQNNAVVFEAPYYELVQENGQANVNLELENNAEAGYLMTVVSKPQNNSIYALLYTDKATEDYAQMQKVGYVDYCPSITLDQNISYTDSVFSVKNATEVSLAKVGTLILLDDELLVYQSYDAVTNKLTVKRAALDTVPKPHLLNAVFYLFDEFRSIDTEQYVASETVQAQVLTTTPSATQKRDPSDVKKLEMNARAIRPYPPANVKINDIYYPQSTVITNDLIVTWVDRNRLQQTGGEILGYFDNSVTRESGVTYSLELSSENTVIHSAENINVNTHTISSSLLIQNKAHTLRLWSVRDSFESYQIFEHSFFVESASLILSATVSKDKVIGSTVPTANINVVVDESLSANMQADGSKISGKTTPNSTITIEIED